MNKAIALSVLAAASFAGVASAQELITNGSFETGDFTGWNYFAPNNTLVVDSVSFFNQPATDGTWVAAFGSVGAAGGVSQSVLANPGDQLTVSFWLESQGGTPNSMSIVFDGVTLLGGSNVGSWSNTFYSFNVTVANANPSLSFSFQNDPNWFIVDAVSVTVAPAPGAAAALGLAGLGAARRRRR